MSNHPSPLPPCPPSSGGRVLKYHSNFYYVEVGGALYECFLKGLLKKEGTEILVGDEVELDSIDESNHTGRITKILPRKNTLTRPKISNVNQVVIVHAMQEPAFSPHQLDRYLTHVTLAGLTPLICVSKCDLARGDTELADIRALYETQLGFAVCFTSVHQETTLGPLLEKLQGKVSVLAGLSGAGKSSLLNKVNPKLQLRVGEVSEKIARGQHTTRHVELMEVLPGTYIADTPGFSNLKFNTVLPTAIESIYPDFAPYRAHCAYPNCLHIDEPECAVLENKAKLAASRYESYREMVIEAEAYKEELQNQSQKEEFGYKTLHRKGKEALQILRLKEKERESSRRRVKQALSSQIEDGLADDASEPL